MNKLKVLLPGQRFDRLSVIEIDMVKTAKYKRGYWKCICDCGEIVSVRRSHLIKGIIKSCKCLARELTVKRNIESTKYLPWQRAALQVHYSVYSDGDLSFEDFLILTNQNCHYCNSPPLNKRIGPVYNKISEEKDLYFIYNGLDRVNPLLPHNKDNLVPCCYICNRAKSDYTYNEFKEWITRIKTHLFFNKNIEKIKKLNENS